MDKNSRLKHFFIAVTESTVVSFVKIQLDTVYSFFFCKLSEMIIKLKIDKNSRLKSCIITVTKSSVFRENPVGHSELFSFFCKLSEMIKKTENRQRFKIEKLIH